MKLCNNSKCLWDADLWWQQVGLRWGKWWWSRRWECGDDDYDYSDDIDDGGSGGDGSDEGDSDLGDDSYDDNDANGCVDGGNDDGDDDNNDLVIIMIRDACKWGLRTMRLSAYLPRQTVLGTSHLAGNRDLRSESQPATYAWPLCTAPSVDK